MTTTEKTPMPDTAETHTSRFTKITRGFDVIFALLMFAGVAVLGLAVYLGVSGAGTLWSPADEIAEQYGLSPESVSIVGHLKRGDNVRALIGGEPYECFKGETWTCRAVLLGDELPTGD